MISQAFTGNKKNTVEYMHPSTPLPKQQQAMLVPKTTGLAEIVSRCDAGLVTGWGRRAYTIRA